MKIHLFAHNSKNLVKKGDFVESYGNYIGEIGNADGKYYAHLHYSVSVDLTPAEIRGYVIGWSRYLTAKHYVKPDVDRSKMFNQPVDNGEAGYGWLQSIGGQGNHPGIDYNGFGGGNSDYGYKFKCPVNGVVIEVADWGSGWGKVILIKEDNKIEKMKEKNQEFYDEKVEKQGWVTLEDWVEGARDYKEEREEYKEKRNEALEECDRLEKLLEHREKNISDLVDENKKLSKKQNNHQLELQELEKGMSANFEDQVKGLRNLHKIKVDALEKTIKDGESIINGCIEEQKKASELISDYTQISTWREWFTWALNKLSNQEELRKAEEEANKLKKEDKK